MTRELAAILGEASRLQAIPLLLHTLGKDAVSASPELSSLYRAQYMQNYLSATLRMKELINMLGCLRDKDIETILLKGAALTMTVYRDLGLRPMQDIDLLIRRDELARATATLCDLGYQRYRPLGPPAQARTDDFHGEVAYVKNCGFTVAIEPHWTLGHKYPYSGRINVDGLWQRAKRARFKGVDAPVLCPEDSLIHLCLHLFQHGQDFWLVPACDIKALVDHYKDSFGWKSFLDRVFKFHLCLPVKYSLVKTSELFHAPVPGYVWEELNAYKPAKSEKRIFSLFAGRDRQSGIVTLADLLTIPGTTQKLNYVFATLFPSREWLVSCYSRPGWPTLGLYALHLKNALTVGTKVLLRFIVKAR